MMMMMMVMMYSEMQARRSPASEPSRVWLAFV